MPEQKKNRQFNRNFPELTMTSSNVMSERKAANDYIGARTGKCLAFLALIFLNND